MIHEPIYVSVATAPAAEPITTAEAKAWGRIDVSEEDSLISALITAARLHVERTCGLALVTQTLDVYYQRWPMSDRLLLPRPPIQSITWIKYTDNTEAEATFSSSNYLFVPSFPAEVVLKDDIDWPDETLSPAKPINIRVVAGYGDASAVPQPIKQAIFLLVQHWYQNREAVVVSSDGNIDAKVVPMAVDALLAPYRSWRR